jgi:hypothetical protein
MSTLRVGTISNSAGTSSVSANSLVAETLGDNNAYAQVNKIAGFTTGTGFTTVVLDELLYNKNITIANGNIVFAKAGVYKLDVGFRFGTGGDNWTGVRLFGAGTTRGTSYGTGNVTNDPGPAMFNFMAEIVNTSVEYSLQIYRASATLAIATPDTNAGRAIVCTIVKVG